MSVYEPVHPALKRIWDRLSPASREARYQQGCERQKILEQVSAALSGVKSERAVLRKLGIDRTSFRRWKKRYLAYGIDGLIDWRVSPPSPVSSEVQAAICTMRRLDPNASVEEIIAHIGEYHHEKTNGTTVKEVLKEAGLARRPGPPPGSKRHEQALVLGGMKLLEAALVETGYLDALVKGVQGCLESAPPNQEAGEADTTGRDRYGRIMASYNERYRKPAGADIGPGFESVEKKRQGLVPARLHLSGARAQVLERKVLALLGSQLLGTGRWEGLRCPRGKLLGEVCGYPYMPSTLDLFVRELKYLGVSSTLWEIHAQLAEAKTRAWGDPRRAAVAYVDGSSKEVHTRLFSQATKVSLRNQVLPALEVVAVHSGAGVPLYQVTYSGRAPLVTEVPKVLEALKPALQNSAVGRIVVIDAEGNSVPFLQGLEQQSPARAWVTRLRPALLKGKRIFNRSNYRAYRKGDRVRTGLVDLAIPHSKDKFRIRVIELERRRKGTVTYLGASTQLSEREWKAAAVADLYFDRWPMQEANFRAVNQAVGSKQVHGYGKQLVNNITVINELGELSEAMQRQQEKLEKAEAELAAQEQVLRDTQLKRRRSARRLETLTRHVNAQVARGERISAALRAELTEQQSLAKSLRAQTAQEDKQHKALDQAKARHEQRRQKQQQHMDRFSELEPRQQIFRHDVELDSLFGLLQVIVVFLVGYLCKEFFHDARMEPVTFLERLFTLPARRSLTPQYEIITFEYNQRDPEVMALLASHREAVNARALHLRNGRILRIDIDPAPLPSRPPPAQRRTTSRDRFHPDQPKV
jgi:hypothetical protein